MNIPVQLDLFSPEIVVSPLKEVPKNDLQTRYIEFRGIKIPYFFARSKRRTIGFMINQEGLKVTAPKWASLKEVEDAIREKGQWITKQLHYFLTKPKLNLKPFQLENGITLNYLGEKITLRLFVSASNFISYNEFTKTLTFFHKASLSTSKLEDELKAWFKEKAYTFFKNRLSFFSFLLGVQYHSFALSNAKQRWGSCSSTAHILLNWRLIYFDPKLIDYVVVHELSHLREMNHSKHFWQLVESVYPNYKAARKELNEKALRLPETL